MEVRERLINGVEIPLDDLVAFLTLGLADRLFDLGDRFVFWENS